MPSTAQNEQEQRHEQTALYALGALNQLEARAFEQQLREDAALAAELVAFDDVVASLAFSAPETVPALNVRERLLAQLAAVEPSPQARETTPSTPRPGTRDLRADEGKWIPLAPKVAMKVLCTDARSGVVTSLIKLEPGGFLPRHRHLGIEQTLVVEGDCRVNGEVFYPGDFRVRPAHTEDTEVTTEHGTVILLIAPEHCEILDAHWPS